MEVIETKIPGLLIIKPKVFEDTRGFFFELFNRDRYAAIGIKDGFVQDNISKSCYGTIRGLHYQLAPYSQSKLVQVLEGAVLDVAVDLRKDSPTFGEHVSIELSAHNRTQFFIPQGFAHGFSVLSETATFIYKCDNPYNQEAERGVAYNDSTLSIDWRIPTGEVIISPKDSALPGFSEAELNFV